jgi:hypothetical protein
MIMRWPTPNEWQLLTVLGEWLSGAGTIAAVVVSLRLARRDAPHVKFRCRVAFLAQMGDIPGYRPSYVVMEAINTSNRPVVVGGFGWRWGIRRRQYAYQMHPVNELSTKLPATLQPGGTASFLIPKKMFVGASDPIRQQLTGSRISRRLKLRAIRAGAHLSTGEQFWRRPDGTVLNLLAQSPEEAIIGSPPHPVVPDA